METETKTKNIQFKDLPPHLQRKYKNSILFDKENIGKAKKYNFDIQKIK